jgi:hypothetical protein
MIEIQRMMMAFVAVLTCMGGCLSTTPPKQPFTLASIPAWAQTPQTITTSDIPDEPRFRVVREVYGCTMIVCRAVDGRHVVLAQSPGYASLQGKVRQGGQIVYMSPSGFRAWRGGPEKWYFEVILKSAQNIIKETPSDQRCGYVIESPAGEMAILAVNGPLKQDELVDLVNSLTLTQPNQ